MRVAVAAALVLLAASPARADVLIDNVNGLTLDEKGEVETFTGLLVGDDGRIEQVYSRRDKRPGNVDYKFDGKGRTLIPGLIDTDVQLMKLGLSLLVDDTQDKGEPRPEDRDLAFSKAQQLLLAQGITTVADMGTTIEDWQSYRRAGDSGGLRLRIVAFAPTVKDMVLIGGPGPSPWLYQDRLRMNGLSLTLDGSLAAGEAWLAHPYEGTPGKTGKPLIAETPFRNMMSRAAIDNFQVAVTANGDAAAGAFLDAVEELKDTYAGDRRWLIVGAQLINPLDVDRFGKNGIVVSVQPADMAAQYQSAAARIGADRLGGAWPWHSLTATGAPIAFSSATSAAAPSPLAQWATAYTRQDAQSLPFGGWQPQERLTREEAFAALSTGGAHALFAEGRLGRIAVGFRADFVLLGTDPLLAPPRELHEMQVLQTWVNGAMVYEAGDVASRSENP